VRIYGLSTSKHSLLTTCIKRVSKLSCPPKEKDADGDVSMDRMQTPVKELESKSKTYRIYQDETLVSFFRRLTFSPDGALLFTPCGIHKTHEDDEQSKHCVYIFTRGNIRG
jgi:hypothetical protein